MKIEKEFGCVSQLNLSVVNFAFLVVVMSLHMYCASKIFRRVYLIRYFMQENK